MHVLLHMVGPHHAGEEEQLSLRLEPCICMQHSRGVDLPMTSNHMHDSNISVEK